MSTLQKTEELLEEYQKKYQDAGVITSSDYLEKIVKTNIKKAEKNYLKIETPKTSSKETYIRHWIIESLEKDFAKKTLIKIDHKKSYSEPYYQAINDYFSLLPIALIRRINQKINNTLPEKRKKLWEDLNFPKKEAEDKFLRLILTRIDYFLKKENSTPLETSIKKFRIPSKDFQKFKENKEKIIKQYNLLLPKIGKLPSWFYSEFNLPCFICQLSEFPFKSINQVKDFLFKKYPSLAAFRHKIRITKGEPSFIKYNKIEDSFLITIDKYSNPRHQIMILIHEMSHIINYLKDFQNDISYLERGRYTQEKRTVETEFSILKDISEDLFRASLGKVLIAFWTTTFEMELYKNPNQDIEKLYANTFNQCFIGAKQKRNPFFVLNENIITQIFSNLPYTIAYSNILNQ